MKMIWVSDNKAVDEVKFFTLRDGNRGAGEAFCMITSPVSAHSPS